MFFKYYTGKVHIGNIRVDKLYKRKGSIPKNFGQKSLSVPSSIAQRSSGLKRA